MTLPSVASVGQWEHCTRNYVKALPILEFPFEKLPNIYLPAKTVLQIDENTRFYALQWCYLRRNLKGRITSFDASSLSDGRLQAMPLALQRLSQWFRFKNHRPRTIEHTLQNLNNFLYWTDQPEHAGSYEAILSDPDLALEALKGYHTYLRNLLQSHQLSSSTAGAREQHTIACLSEIHSRAYLDEIEPLQSMRGNGTEAPDDDAVAEFSSTLQAIFDSASEIVLSERSAPPEALLRVSALDDTKVVQLRKGYGPLRLMELACVAYAGLVFVDSGANLAVLKDIEESGDFENQLAEPDRINLTQKAIKFRAGGKKVEVYLSATTMTRLRIYLRVRQALVASLDSGDIAPLFVHCTYDASRNEPTGICPLSKNFLNYLRRKVIRSGASIPSVTLRQLRAYKQQELVRKASVAVAAKIMGHSVDTAIKAYCKSKDSERRSEMSEFLGSLQNTVLTTSRGVPERALKQVTPIGICTNHGNPSITASSVVAPDCSKVQGCFFCKNYRLHADATDISKLMSCRRVLQYITPLNGDSVRAERVYMAVVDRIDALLEELQRRQPKVYETIREEVEERGQITRYWAGKLQQLHLLGMLPTSTAK